jgi:hypothetical protein
LRVAARSAPEGENPHKMLDFSAESRLVSRALRFVKRRRAAPP